MLKSALVSVDIINQFHAVGAKFPGARIDYRLFLRRALRDEYTLFRGFVYGAQIAKEAIHFITALKYMGFEPKYFQAPTVEESPLIAATDITMHMVMDAWRASDRIDAFIVGSNDVRLIPLLERMKELGIKVIVFACNIPPEISRVADRCMSIDPRVFVKARDGATVPTQQLAMPANIASDGSEQTIVEGSGDDRSRR